MKSLAFMFMLVLPWGLAAQTHLDDSSLRSLLSKDKAVVVLDVRTAEEFAAGHLPGAKLLPFDAIDAASAQKVIPTKGTTVVVYCHSGRRSGIAAQTLLSLGYSKVWDLGAIAGWKGSLVTGPK